MYCDGMGYMIERRRRGKNIAGGEADRRNPRIAAPSTNEPRSGGKRTNGGDTPYAREPYIIYSDLSWRGNGMLGGIAQRKRSFSLSTKVRVFFKPTSLIIRKNYIFFIF